MGNTNHFVSESIKYSKCMEGIKIEVSFFYILAGYLLYSFGGSIAKKIII